MRIILLVLSLLAVSATAHARDPANALKDDWTALMATGCDLVKHRVRTPIEASVLRNTPYALAGYAFKSKGLRAIFSADGGWYTPKGKATPKFSPAVSACIKKLKTLEATWKSKVGNNKALKEAVFRDRSSYLEVRSHSKLMVGGASEWSSSKLRAEVKCRDCKALQYYQLVCPSFEADTCMVVVPGTGDLP